MLPPSLNSMYRSFKGRMILSENARTFKGTAPNYIPDNIIEYMSLNHDFYDVEIVFSMPLLYRNDGKINLKSGDIDNMCKALIDVIFTASGQNDSKITTLRVVKRYGEKENTEFIISGCFLNMQKL